MPGITTRTEYDIGISSGSGNGYDSGNGTQIHTDHGAQCDAEEPLDDGMDNPEPVFSSSAPMQAQGPGGDPHNTAFDEWYKAFLQPSQPSSVTPRHNLDDPDADCEPDDLDADGLQDDPPKKRYRPSPLDTAVHVSTHAENTSSHDRQSRRGRITEEAKQEKLRLHMRWQNIAQQELAKARAQSQAIKPLDAAAVLADIHPSHNLKLLRNAAFCSTCG